MKQLILFAVASVFVLCTAAMAAKIAGNPAAGKATYDASCATCHKTGLMGAMKVGDKAAWAPHTQKGFEVMVTNSIKGYKGAKGMMPPKGGNAKLTDQQIADAVAYMTSMSK